MASATISRSERGNRVSDFLWISLPRQAIKRSTLAGAVLADGAYLRAWQSRSLAFPLASLLTGLVLGAAHPGDLYTYSLPVMCILAIPSGLGASLGLWTLVGYVAGDFFLSGRDSSSRLAPSLDVSSIKVVSALILSYLILAGLLVLIPVIASTVRLGVTFRFGSHTFATGPSSAALVLTQMALAHLWTQSTPFLIRPAWSYFDTSPTVAAIEPLQQRGWMLAVVVGLAAVGRLSLERKVSSKLDPIGTTILEVPEARPSHWPAQAARRGLFIAFVMSGFFSSWPMAFVTAIIAFGIFALQLGVLPRLPGYVHTVLRVPFLWRLAVAVLVSYTLGVVIVERARDNGSTSFVSLIIATLLSLLILSLLLPDETHHKAPEGASDEL